MAPNWWHSLLKNLRIPNPLLIEQRFPWRRLKNDFLQVNIQKTRDFHCGLFWQAVGRSLERCDLSAQEKKNIEAAIEEKVPRPSDDCWALWGVTCIPRFES